VEQRSTRGRARGVHGRDTARVRLPWAVVDLEQHEHLGRAVAVGIEDAMTADVPVAVAVVSSQFEAELIVGLLQSNGVDAAVSADDAGGQEPQLQLQGVRVLVDRDDAVAARRILADAQAEQLSAEELSAEE